MKIEEIKAGGLPEHVAVIMDGNGRWAKQRGLSRSLGHKEGLNSAKRIVATAASLGIKYITLYTFSTENWKRTQDEVGYLMTLIKGHLRSEFQFYKDNGIKIEHIGDLTGLPKDVQNEILNAKKDTEHFSGTTCVLAINYGSRDEIVRGIRKITENSIKPEEITEEFISKSLDIKDLPDVDLMIRTGGEQRLSNFLLYQCAYAEFVFPTVLWPDFDINAYHAALSAFTSRDRRFGGRNK